MIFDDYDNLSENQDTLTPTSKSLKEGVTSLENFHADREEKLKQEDHLHFYDVYQIHINKAYLTTQSPKKRSKMFLGKRPSISNLAKKKKKCKENFLLLLTDQKKRSLDDIESGIEEDNLSIEELKVSHTHNSGRCELFDSASVKSDGQLTIENEVSIDHKTRADETMYLIDNNKAGFRSLNRLTNIRDFKSQLKKTRSADDMYKTPVKDKDKVQLESFVSLDEIVNNPTPIKAEDEVCSICTKEYVLKDFIARLKTCNHIFHKNCIDDYIKETEFGYLNCPVCQKGL